MAEDKHRHHLFGRRHKEEEVEERISDDVKFKGGGHGFAGGDYSSENIGGDYSQIIEENIEDYEKKKKEHTHNVHLGEIDALADDDDIDLYEKVDAKKDSEHGHKHKIEEEVSTIGGVGAAGCASCHERHEKKEVKEDEEEEEEEEEVEVKKKTNHLF